MSNVGKALALAAFVATAPAFQQALCTGGNIADVTAKGQVREGCACFGRKQPHNTRVSRWERGELASEQETARILHTWAKVRAAAHCTSRKSPTRRILLTQLIHEPHLAAGVKHLQVVGLGAYMSTELDLPFLKLFDTGEIALYTIVGQWGWGGEGVGGKHVLNWGRSLSSLL